ncbi:hypothetical protein HDU93_004070 [Gonapodya sp. JEL0774]|nr:hypothetical protein HDU93_004070 [Gonapodya sp. JEL0774]
MSSDRLSSSLPPLPIPNHPGAQSSATIIKYPPRASLPPLSTWMIRSREGSRGGSPVSEASSHSSPSFSYPPPSPDGTHYDRSSMMSYDTDDTADELRSMAQTLTLAPTGNFVSHVGPEEFYTSCKSEAHQQEYAKLGQYHLPPLLPAHARFPTNHEFAPWTLPPIASISNMPNQLNYPQEQQWEKESTKLESFASFSNLSALHALAEVCAGARLTMGPSDMDISPDGDMTAQKEDTTSAGQLMQRDPVTMHPRQQSRTANSSPTRSVGSLSPVPPDSPQDEDYDSTSGCGDSSDSDPEFRPTKERSGRKGGKRLSIDSTIGSAKKFKHRKKAMSTKAQAQVEPRFGNGRRPNFSKDQKAIMMSWLHTNKDHPFPTESEKLKFCDSTGLSLRQINDWFINARRRYL